MRKFVDLFLVEVIGIGNKNWGLERKYGYKCKENIKESLDKFGDWFRMLGSRGV